MEAYERGRAAVLGGENLNKSAPDQSYWLAMAVPAARAALAKEDVADLSAPPEWEALSLVEQRSLAVAWEALSGADTAGLKEYGFLRPEARWMELYVANHFAQMQKLVLTKAVLDMPEACEIRFLQEACNAVNTTAWPHFVIAIIIMKSTRLEDMHGRIRQALPDPRTFSKDMEEKNLVRWMAEFGDPDFWHVYAGQPRIQPIVLSWILEQPNCDLATAARIFLRLSGPVWFDALAMGLLEPEATGPEVQRLRSVISPGMGAMCENIVQRARAGYYKRAELARDHGPEIFGNIRTPGALPEPLFPGREKGRALRTPFYVVDERYIRVSLI